MLLSHGFQHYLLILLIHDQLECTFHEHFYNGDHEWRLSHLTLIRQKLDEHVAEYIRRFRDIKSRCYSLIISKKDLTQLALNGLRSHIKEKTRRI